MWTSFLGWRTLCQEKAGGGRSAIYLCSIPNIRRDRESIQVFQEWGSGARGCDGLEFQLPHPTLVQGWNGHLSSDPQRFLGVWLSLVSVEVRHLNIFEELGFVALLLIRYQQQKWVGDRRPHLGGHKTIIAPPLQLHTRSTDSKIRVHWKEMHIFIRNVFQNNWKWMQMKTTFSK